MQNPDNLDHLPHLRPPQSFGDQLADKVAAFGGSWTFISLFFLSIFTWMALNAYGVTHPFDPFPFILLNLVLSCLASIQAPIILMSQNRKEYKDRLRAIHDYRVNLKAEKEIRTLHDKIDELKIRLLHDKVDELDRLLRQHLPPPPLSSHE